MPTPSLKPALLALAALTAALASAQMRGGPDSAKNNPRLIAIDAAEARAGKLIGQSRLRLREGKLAQAEALAQAAVREGDEVDYKDALALGMLAEVYLAEGEPDIAISTLDELKLGREIDRSVYVRAVCLVRMGDLAKARRVLVGATGDGKATWSGSRSGIRRAHGLLPLPMDEGDSPAALEATALLLRSDALDDDAGDMERLEDLRAAASLAPDSALAHYLLAEALIDRDRFDEATVEVNRAARLGKPWVERNLRDYLQQHQESYPRRHPAKADGPKAP